MAAVMEAELDRSPTPATVDHCSDDDAMVDEDLLAEERKLQRSRVAEDDPVVQERPESEVNGEAGAKLLELVGKSELYSEWLADQFNDVVEQTLKQAAAPDEPEGERPAKRSRTARGKQATSQPAVTATKRLLPLIHAELRDYQLKGVAWLISLYKNGVNGILADEMGLGKTLQTIGFISYLWTHSKDTSGKYLVVAPLSTLSNWAAEFNRFCPDIPVLVYHGSTHEREELRRQYMKIGGKEQMPVIIASYEMVIVDRRFLDKHVWKLAVVDEGHRLKNFECRLFRELRQMKLESRLLLTGTPLQNNLRELWSLLSFCMPAVFADSEQFLDWFDIRTPATAIPAALTAPLAGSKTAPSSSAPAPAKKRGRKPKAAAKAKAEEAEAQGEAVATDAAAKGEPADTVVNADSKAVIMISRLHAVLKPFVLRRVKADVHIGVPPKQEMVLYAEMTEEQRRMTQGLIDGTLQDEMDKEAGHGIRPKRLNNLIMQMRKVCNHPDLITGPASGVTAYPPAAELVAQCGKLALMDRLLKQLLAKGHKVLIFSQMTEMLNVIEAYLQDLGMQPLRIDGSMDLKDRKESIAEFQSAASDKNIFLLSTRAGGLGINLVAADTVIIYDSDWNPHQDSQAMDRCHRIGQTKPVLVFRLVTANSVENRMLAKADSKKALERIVIKKGAFKELQQTESSTSMDELVQLLNPDRRSGDLAQSGVVSDDMLNKLLDRGHLVRAFEASKAGTSQAGGSASDVGPPVPPYPLVGVGYEVVVDEPRRAVGLLQRIEGDDKEGVAAEVTK